MKEYRFTGPIELRTLPDGQYRLVGRSPLYGSRSAFINREFYETVRPGAVKDFLASGENVRCLVEHRRGQPLGNTSDGSLRLFDEPGGLRFECDLVDSPHARKLVDDIRSGAVRSSSFGFAVDDPLGQSWSKVNGVPHRELRKIRLLDVSAVRHPAYAMATAGLVTVEEPAAEPAYRAVPTPRRRRFRLACHRAMSDAARSKRPLAETLPLAVAEEPSYRFNEHHAPDGKFTSAHSGYAAAGRLDLSHDTHIVVHAPEATSFKLSSDYGPAMESKSKQRIETHTSTSIHVTEIHHTAGDTRHSIRNGYFAHGETIPEHLSGAEHDFDMGYSRKGALKSAAESALTAARGEDDSGHEFKRDRTKFPKAADVARAVRAAFKPSIDGGRSLRFAPPSPAAKPDDAGLVERVVSAAVSAAIASRAPAAKPAPAVRRITIGELERPRRELAAMRNRLETHDMRSRLYAIEAP